MPSLCIYFHGSAYSVRLANVKLWYFITIYNSEEYITNYLCWVFLNGISKNYVTNWLNSLFLNVIWQNYAKWVIDRFRNTKFRLIIKKSLDDYFQCSIEIIRFFCKHDSRDECTSLRQSTKNHVNSTLF